MDFNKEQTNSALPVKRIEVTFSTTIDMSEIYFNLGMYHKSTLSKCPTLFCGLKLWDNYDYIVTVLDNTPILVYTREGLSNKDVLKIMNGDTKEYIGVEMDWPVDLPCPYNTNYDISKFYLVGAKLAKSMNVRCPHIFLRNTPPACAKDMKGLNSYGPDIYGKTTQIDIFETPKYHQIDLLETLAHEMRHCWQHEYFPRKYFTKYKFYTDFSAGRKKDYYLQPAELDAYAYALRFIRAATGYNYPSNLTIPGLNRKIEKYAKTLDASLFEPLEGLLVN